MPSALAGLAPSPGGVYGPDGADPSRDGSADGGAGSFAGFGSAAPPAGAALEPDADSLGGAAESIPASGGGDSSCGSRIPPVTEPAGRLNLAQELETCVFP